MPTIEISHKDLCSLIGKDIPLQKLQEEGILYAKGEIEEVSGDKIKVEIKDTNRPDLWSCEGIARELKGRFGNPKFPEYTIKKSNLVVKVDRSLKNIRPYTACAVVKNLNMTENVLSQLIQLQEKMSETFGRNRKEIAIGVYDLHKIKPPITFTTVKPDEIKFVPLGFSKKMTPKEILEKHPKGKEFGFLLKDKSQYPVFIDASDHVLSLVPIINSDHTGKVTTDTKNLFIESSGSDLKLLKVSLNVIVSALADRGGKIESVEVIYSDKKLITPDLKPKKFRTEIKYLRKISGLEITDKKIIDLLKSANYKVMKNGNSLELLYPAYRQDIMHPVDVAEDLLISYGYNKIIPSEPELLTKGSPLETEVFSRKISHAMIGTGLQEIMSYTLTNKENLLSKMNLKEIPLVEIENPISSRWSVFRNWLLPSVLDFLSNNTHMEYPQKIFEIGDCVVINSKKETRTQDERKLAAALTNTSAGYEDISSILDAFFASLGLRYELIPHNHPSFIPGRCANILINRKNIGIIGEIHPTTLNAWKLEKPTAGFELDLDKIHSFL